MINVFGGILGQQDRYLRKDLTSICGSLIIFLSDLIGSELFCLWRQLRAGGQFKELLVGYHINVRYLHLESEVY